MIEGLFLDRVDAIAARAAIGGQHDLILGPRTHETQPALAIVELAQPRTHIAPDAAIVERVPVAARYAGEFLIPLFDLAHDRKNLIR
jgi:hypothetical protein